MNDLYSQITSLKNLAPSRKINKLFEELVKTALSESTNTLSSKKMARLQLTCAKAEYELEKYWALKIINSKNPRIEILKFPYYANYEKLTQMEWFSLLSCTKHKSHKAAFVGSGPLPLTAIILASKYKVKTTILDIDEDAVGISMKLIKKLNLEKKIIVKNADGAKFEKYSKFNLIFVAALAGVNAKTKENILKKIRNDTKKGTHILARSSWGMREILYKPLDQKIFKILKPVIEVRPHNDVVNSVVIFENS